MRGLVLLIKLTLRTTMRGPTIQRVTNKLRSRDPASTSWRWEALILHPREFLPSVLIGLTCFKNCQQMRVCTKLKKAGTRTTRINLLNKKRLCSLLTGYSLSSQPTRNIWHSKTSPTSSTMSHQNCSSAWWHYCIRNYRVPQIALD